MEIWRSFLSWLQHRFELQSYFTQNKHWPWQAEAPRSIGWKHGFFLEWEAPSFICLSLSLSLLVPFIFSVQTLSLGVLLLTGCFFFLFQLSPSVLQRSFHQKEQKPDSFWVQQRCCSWLSRLRPWQNRLFNMLSACSLSQKIRLERFRTKGT